MKPLLFLNSCDDSRNSSYLMNIHNLTSGPENNKIRPFLFSLHDSMYIRETKKGEGSLARNNSLR